jgi:hypothetical protein
MKTKRMHRLNTTVALDEETGMNVCRSYDYGGHLVEMTHNFYGYYARIDENDKDIGCKQTPLGILNWILIRLGSL